MGVSAQDYNSDYLDSLLVMLKLSEREQEAMYPPHLPLPSDDAFVSQSEIYSSIAMKNGLYTEKDLHQLEDIVKLIQKVVKDGMSDPYIKNQEYGIQKFVYRKFQKIKQILNPIKSLLSVFADYEPDDFDTNDRQQKDQWRELWIYVSFMMTDVDKIVFTFSHDETIRVLSNNKISKEGIKEFKAYSDRLVQKYGFLRK